MLTQQTVIDKVKKFTDEIIGAGVNLRKVILFGSFTRKEQRVDSGIDVCLVSDEFIGLPFLDLDTFMHVKIKREYNLLQVKTFSTEEFVAGNPFIEKIEKTGIVVFDALVSYPSHSS